MSTDKVYVNQQREYVRSVLRSLRIVISIEKNRIIKQLAKEADYRERNFFQISDRCLSITRTALAALVNQWCENDGIDHQSLDSFLSAVAPSVKYPSEDRIEITLLEI